MIWVLQSRAEKERNPGTEPRPNPALAPVGLPPVAPETPQPTSLPAESGVASGIGRADGVLLDEVEKKLEQIERRVQSVERQLGQLSGHEAEHQNCKEKCRQLAALKEALNRHRQQQTRPDDPSVNDIQKEVQAISQWLDTLPAPLRDESTR